MHKKVLFGIFAFALLTVLFGACAIKEQVQASTELGMGASDFVEQEVTISKGEAIGLVNETSTQHIVTNGEWDGSTQKPAAEADAPQVNLNISGSGKTAILGPFTTAGTFKFYCPLHPGMNLTVTVE